MNKNITISLDDDLQQSLEKECQRAGRDCEEFVQDMLRRYLTLQEVERLRKKFVPRAKALGYHTDEDIFRVVS
ncbi:MAG: ribbon-helix-helix protein, CopG family [Nitrospinales bacterium]